MSVSTPVRVAVIGAGMMGERHATCVSQSGRAELVAVADLDLGRAQELATRLGLPAYQSHREALSQADIDAVIVCTPDWAHREVCLDALGDGKHVLVEKPLAMTVEDCDAIMAAAKEAGVTLMVGHILHFDPRYVAAREAVTSGEIGAVSYLYARRSNTVAQARRFGGRTTVLHYLAVHDVEWMLWTVGEPITDVYAASSRKALQDLGVDNAVFMSLRFSGGAVGCVQAAWARSEHDPVALDACLEVVGTKGSVHVDTPSEGVRVEGARPLRVDTTYGFALSGEVGGALREEVERFLQCVQQGTAPPVDARQGRAAVAVIVAAAESARSGRPVSVVT